MHLPSCGASPCFPALPAPPPQVLLYTERAQFYNRHRIRGAKVGEWADPAPALRRLREQALEPRPPTPPSHAHTITKPRLLVPLPCCPPPLPCQSILFYQLPEHPQFYAELLNLMEEGEAGEAPTGARARGRAGREGGGGRSPAGCGRNMAGGWGGSSRCRAAAGWAMESSSLPPTPPPSPHNPAPPARSHGGVQQV